MPNKQQQPSADVPYDSKGRCIYHPQIRLRKRSTLKRNWITVNKHCPSCLAEILSSSSYDDDIDNKTSHTRRRPQDEMCPTNNIMPPSSVHDDDKARPHHDAEEDDEYEDFECSSSTLTTAEETISSYSSASLSSSLSSLDGSHNAAHYATDYDDNADNDNQGPQRTKVVCGMPYVYYSYVRCSPQEYCNQGGGGEGGGGNVYQEQQEYEQYGFYTGEIDAMTSLPYGIGTWRCNSNGPNDGEERGGGGTTLLEGSWFDGHLYTQSNSPQSQQQQQQQRRLTPIMEHSLFYDEEEEESCLMYDNNEGIGMSLDDGEPIYNNSESSSSIRTRRSVDPPSSLEGTHRIISGERDSGGGVGSSSNNERETNGNISSLSLCTPCRI